MRLLAPMVEPEGIDPPWELFDLLLLMHIAHTEGLLAVSGGASWLTAGVA
jgi:hypothetical protein